MFEKLYKTGKVALLFVFISTSTIVFSQEKTIHFGLSFNAKITHQIFDNSNSGNSDDEFSYTASGNIYYDLSSTIQLISGLSFSHYKINQIDYSPIFACDINPTLGADPSNSYFKENYKTSYLGIPLEGRWNIGNKANRFFIQMGVEGLFKIALNKNLAVVECGANEREISLPADYKEVNNFLLLARIGVGYEFPIGKKMELFFEPNVEYSLTKFFKTGSGNCKFFNFGLNSGVKF